MQIGGQALPNGVMIRSPYKTSVVLRHRSGKLLIDSWPNKNKITIKISVLRGIYQFIISLAEAYRTVYRSVKLSKSAGKMRIAPLTIICTVAACLLLGLYVYASDFFFYLQLVSEFSQYVLFTLIFSFTDIIIFFIVVFLITRMPPMKKLLKFHGAEHKAIACYDKGLKMTVDNVREQSRFHQRCGTSMMVTVILASIIIPIFIPPNIPEIYQTMMFTVFALIAVGITYEAMRSKKTTWVTRIGMAAQRITTQEPDDAMIECAIAAVSDVVNVAN